MGDLFRDEMREYFPKLADWTIFVNIMDKKISNTTNNIIISDGRLYDEIQWFKTLPNSYIIKIVRNNNIECIDTHKTENFVCDSDFTIINENSLEDLYKQIDQIFINILPSSLDN
jgi:hypothetical protein